MTVLALAATLSQAAPAVAQKLSISPTIGVYIPTSELLKAANGDEFKQEIGLAVGGRLGLDFSPRFGILTTVTYVPSDLKLDLATGQQVKNKANLLLGSARATFYVLPVTSPVWLSVNGGGSYVRRSGAAYEGVEDKDDIGGVVGTAVGFRLGHQDRRDLARGGQADPERRPALVRLRDPARPLIGSVGWHGVRH
jgi:hypothetical protein